MKRLHPSLALALVLSTALPAYAQVYRKDYSVIPGTQGITVGPGIDLSNWNTPDHNLEYGIFSYGAGYQLAGASFAESDLAFTNFGASDLSNTDFTGANLTGARLDWANLSHASLAHADLTNASLLGPILVDTDFTGARITGVTIEASSYYSVCNPFTMRQLRSTANYSRHDLSGVQLVAMNLQGCSLAWQNLTNASFSWSNLAHANFTGANISQLALEDVKGLTAAQIYSTASYSHHDLHGICIESDDLRGINLAHQNLANADLGYVNIAGANLAGADLTNALISGADFSHAAGLTARQLYSTQDYANRNLGNIGLAGLGLTAINLAHQNLAGATLAHSTLARASLASADLSHSNLSGANLSGADLSLANFNGANLRGANLSGADLLGADFSGANIRGANFHSTWGFNADQLRSTATRATGDFSHLNFSGPYVDLSYGDFESMNLTGTLFSGTNLADADFDGANLSGADFTGADLRGAEAWSPVTVTRRPTGNLKPGLAAILAQSRAASRNTIVHNTILPDGTIHGLNLAAGEVLAIRDNWTGIAITIDTTATAARSSTIRFVFDDYSSDCTSAINFAPGLTPNLRGTLDLEPAPDTDPILFTDVPLNIFSWNGPVPASNRFSAITTAPGWIWDLSHLYTTGTITLLSAPDFYANSLSTQNSALRTSPAPEPASLALLFLTAPVLLILRRPPASTSSAAPLARNPLRHN